MSREDLKIHHVTFFDYPMEINRGEEKIVE